MCCLHVTACILREQQCAACFKSTRYYPGYYDPVYKTYKNDGNSLLECLLEGSGIAGYLDGHGIDLDYSRFMDRIRNYMTNNDPKDFLVKLVNYSKENFSRCELFPFLARLAGVA